MNDKVAEPEKLLTSDEVLKATRAALTTTAGVSPAVLEVVLKHIFASELRHDAAELAVKDLVKFAETRAVEPPAK